MRITRILLAGLFCIFIAGSMDLFAQEPLAKSRIVYEEKFEKGQKKTMIDSEEKYDLRGNTIEEIEYKDGKMDKHMQYEYDADNNRIRETELDENGKIKKTAEYKYEKGLRKEKLSYDAGKNLISRKTYNYTF